MNTTIREARQQDAPHINDFNARLAAETEATTLDRDVLAAGVRAALADRAKAIYFMAEVDGQVVGQLMITREWSDWRNGDIWWIQSVYVKAAFRRRGVFRALYERARDRARESGAVGMRLYVDQDNVAAQQTYQTLGMAPSRYRVMEELFAK